MTSSQNPRKTLEKIESPLKEKGPQQLKGESGPNTWRQKDSVECGAWGKRGKGPWGVSKNEAEEKKVEGMRKDSPLKGEKGGKGL